MTNLGDWDCTRNWRRITEQRLAKIHSEVSGLHEAHANRIVDLVEELERVKKETMEALEKVIERQDKMRDWVVSKLGKNGGE